MSEARKAILDYVDGLIDTGDAHISGDVVWQVADLQHSLEAAQREIRELRETRTELLVLIDFMRVELIATFEDEACDHNVGICFCGIHELIERATEALK